MNNITFWRVLVWFKPVFGEMVQFMPSQYTEALLSLYSSRGAKPLSGSYTK